MQRDRRRDPQPWTWEAPVAVAVVLALIGVAAAQLGRSLANLAAGAGWTWPIPDAGGAVASPFGAAFWTSLPPVLRGDASAGLGPSAAHRRADPWLVWAGIAVCETAVMVLAVVALTYGWRRWGPDRLRGMATRSEAEALLGLSRLRRVAPLVRPDLHSRTTRPPRAGAPAAFGSRSSAQAAPDPGVIKDVSAPWARRRLTRSTGVDR